MESGGSMPYSQGLSNNPYPESSNKNNNNNNLNNLWNPEFQCYIQKGSSSNPILNWFHPTPHIETYLFMIHSNIALSSLILSS